MKLVLLKIIDSCYFLFERFLPLKTYRYAVCGGGNMVLDTLLYFLTFHFVFRKDNFDMIILVLSPHIASLFMVFPITFLIGFMLNRYIVFKESNLPMKTQLIRYFSVGIVSLLISYLLMKCFVDILLFYPTPSRIATTIISIIFSSIMQNTFSFKVVRS